MQLEAALKQYYGFDEFRPGQKEILEDILSGHDVLGMLPTGTGKTLIYQLAAVLLKGRALIVSPLVSLMQDQVDQFKQTGFKKTVALNSFLDQSDKRSILKHLKDYQFVFVSPEIMQNNYIRSTLLSVEWSLFVVDEAHCISQWGHEFRPHYLDLVYVKKELGDPVCLALTATATVKVQEDIQKYLGIEKAKVHIHSVNRPNISLFVESFSDLEHKQDRAIDLISELKGPGIVYTNTRRSAEQLVNLLHEKGMHNVSYYHGGMEQDERLLVQKQFLNSQLKLIVCTNAFGMGINKPDIRYVLHYHAPSNMEGYVQEIGRAGRDLHPSAAILLYHPSDLEIPFHFIENELPDHNQIDFILSDYDVLSEQTVAERLHLAGISETGQRFMEYHLNSAGVLNEKGISEDKRESLKKTLKLKIEARKKEKLRSLRMIENWIMTNGCKRNMLLNYFGEEEKNDMEYCCSGCQDDLERFYGKEEPKLLIDHEWEDELKRLFRQEV
ncbi:RecQ family ATP-dependent DNA helicase [Fictibacillus phosphorivorans]|uniref:RecQ family ATP-dependent DNA helicase n=1 Tax=Fictibacillus phosphorivorans TaxID=1221500 RepID=UPI0020417B13|nr:ATP-dependent DNA helicase RecQ [Fictibacillus phosphorivorans]MCM3720313.1 ATP-dependent DNA helicase [Fictibacillus phosphorivorans]MCM3778003.1 ATP-dependent DNA helicase [Fictibacillus phosphorivorans]